MNPNEQKPGQQHPGGQQGGGQQNPGQEPGQGGQQGGGQQKPGQQPGQGGQQGGGQQKPGSSQDKAASKVASRNLGKADNRLSAEFRYHPDENAPGLGWSGRHWRPSATPRALQLERPAA
jgi:hypothetical protein